MIADEPVVEAQDADSVVDGVATVPTWRDALLARLRPADHRISDEEIFAILNGGAEGQTAAELCGAAGVTVPMYCVWKSKYRQLTLEELRQARRREQRRRYTIAGVVVGATTLSTGAIVVALAWVTVSALTGVTTSPSATPAAASNLASTQPPAAVESPIVRQQTVPPVIADPPAPAEVEPTAPETGYRIQVTAADNDQQGRAMVAQLASKGYPAYMTRAVVGNKNVFRVRVGPFETLPAAEDMAAQLRSAGYTGAWIAR